MKILHISVPKNGGTYIANNLARNFEAAQRYIVDESTIRLGEFLPKADEVTSRFDFVAGHIPFKLVAPYASKFDLIISSFREPWARCWSTYQFVTSRQPAWTHLKASDKAAAVVHFERFVDEYFIANRPTRNNQCGYIGDVNLPRSAMENIDRYGIRMISCDNLEGGLRTLMRNHGLVFNEGMPKNESATGFTIGADDSASLDQKIRDWFSGDFQLYESLTMRLARRPAAVAT